MTGYGQAFADLPAGRISVEVRSLNHRFAEFRIRLPEGQGALEMEVRRKVLARVRRGRVELSIQFEPAPASAEDRPRLNQPLLDEVLAAAGRIADQMRAPGPLDVAALLGVPGMFQAGRERPAWGAAHTAALDHSLDAALAALDEQRLREGRHLAQELERGFAAMRTALAALGGSAAGQPRRLRDRLLERLRALDQELALDPLRVAQEAALCADRSDVTEELARLEGHLAQLQTLVARPDGEPLGKRLDFLLQEVHREANTINSKSSDLETSQHGLALKLETEKMREQVQNVE